MRVSKGSFRLNQIFISLTCFTLVSTGGMAESLQAEKRFQIRSAELRKILTPDAEPQAAAKLLVEKNSRIYLFFIEGLLRLYKPKHERFSEQKDVVKELEDVLGFYVDAGEHIEYAQSLNVPPKIISHLEEVRGAGRERVARLLQDKDWVGSKKTALDRLDKAVGKSLWEAAAETLHEELGLKKKEAQEKIENRDLKRKEREAVDLANREFLVERLRDHLDKVENEEFDFSKLQEGIHEYRRQVRWFLMYVQALNGMIRLDEKDCPAEALKPLLTQPIATNKYVEFPVSDEEPIARYIPKCLFIKVTQASEDLGSIKDTGEAIEWLEEAALESGYSKDKASAHTFAEETVKKHPKYVADVPGSAAKVLKEMKDNKVLSLLSKALKHNETPKP